MATHLKDSAVSAGFIPEIKAVRFFLKAREPAETKAHQAAAFAMQARHPAALAL